MRFRRHLLVVLVLAAGAAAQSSSDKTAESERTFSQPVAVVQAALRKLPGGTSGRLPVLDGFVVPGAHTLSSYQRPYYQSEVRVTATKTGGSLVRVTAKITAWYRGTAGSGYEALQSNGRVESDLLDRLQDGLAPSSASKAGPGQKDASHSTAKSKVPEIDAPVPQLPDHAPVSHDSSADAPGPQDSQLQQEARSLEEILRNQSHPSNLIAVRQDKTPVLQSPSVDAKVLFLASSEDEFEVLEETPGWVHVRISGLSRGWLRRAAVEMPGDSQARPEGESVANSAKSGEAEHTQSPAPFSVSSEEVGSFPGEWASLKGKNVKIISLQQAAGTGRITSPQEKKQFAEALFKKESQGLAAEVAGMVLVFDAEDGGMIAVTRAALEQWNRGALSPPAFWKQCFLDPPEILGEN